MSKSKKKTYTPQGKEADHLNTQTGLGNVGEALDSAMKPNVDETIKQFDDLLTEVKEKFPDRYESLSDDAINIAETDSIPGAIKFLTNELNKLDDQASAEKPEETPAKETPKPKSEKAVEPWYSHPSTEYNNLQLEVCQLRMDAGYDQASMQQWVDDLIAMPTEEDAIKSLINQKSNLVKNKVAENNNSNKEEQIMADNKETTVVETTTINPAVAAAQAAQVQAVATPAKASSALTTTEKVVLWTAIGVGAAALLFSLVAIAKANKANARITDLELGGNDVM